MKTDIDNTLIRYGKLHLTKQKGFGSDTFHAPPTTFGFYAMPIRFQELFLVGSIESYQPGQLGIPKAPKYGEDGYETYDWDKFNELRKKRYKKIIHKFTVKNDDYIWHHLDVKHNVIVDSYGVWNKTLVRDWKKALSKESVKLRAESLHYDPIFGNSKNLSEVRPKTGWFSKDHFEVFIDSKVY